MSDQKNEEDESASKYGCGFWVIIILAVSLAALFSLPNLIGTFHIASHGNTANACINNLRQIDAAANQFALENHKTNGGAINFPTDLMPYIKLNSAGKIPGCPQGGSYSIKKVGDKPTCSLGTTVTPPHILE
jgi:hypothetical protein